MSVTGISSSYSSGSQQVMMMEQPREPPTTVKSYSTRKRLCVAGGVLAGVLILAALAGLIAWLVTGGDDSFMTQAMKRRIDCFPEAEGGVETLNKSGCESRGCTYDPVGDFPQVPPCFVPQTRQFGYKVLSGPHETSLGQRWQLERLTENGIYGENIERLTFEVEMRGTHMLRFKVGRLREAVYAVMSHGSCDHAQSQGKISHPNIAHSHSV